jgi:hypothetical protein
MKIVVLGGGVCGTIGEDRARLREIEPPRTGVQPDPPATPEAQLRAALITAIPHDPSRDQLPQLLAA